MDQVNILDSLAPSIYWSFIHGLLIMTEPINISAFVVLVVTSTVKKCQIRRWRMSDPTSVEPYRSGDNVDVEVFGEDVELSDDVDPST